MEKSGQNIKKAMKYIQYAAYLALLLLLIAVIMGWLSQDLAYNIMFGYLTFLVLCLTIVVNMSIALKNESENDIYEQFNLLYIPLYKKIYEEKFVGHTDIIPYLHLAESKLISFKDKYNIILEKGDIIDLDKEEAIACSLKTALKEDMETLRSKLKSLKDD